MKQFTSQMKQGDLVIDEKCTLVHKYLQHFQQKLLARPSWGVTCKCGTTVCIALEHLCCLVVNEEYDDHMISEACQFVQHVCYSNVYRNVFHPNGVNDQSKDQ